MRRHMKLVKARYVKAHHYFAAKNRAAATHKLLGRWNKAFASAARKRRCHQTPQVYLENDEKGLPRQEKSHALPPPHCQETRCCQNMKPLTSEATTTG